MWLSNGCELLYFLFYLKLNIFILEKVQTVSERLRFRTNLFELREQRKLKPVVLYNMLTNLLYERRFGPYFVFGLVIGLDPKTGETYVYDTDNIGALSDNVNLATIGTASDYIFGLGRLQIDNFQNNFYIIL